MLYSCHPRSPPTCRARKTSSVSRRTSRENSNEFTFARATPRARFLRAPHRVASRRVAHTHHIRLRAHARAHDAKRAVAREENARRKRVRRREANPPRARRRREPREPREPRDARRPRTALVRLSLARETVRSTRASRVVRCADALGRARRGETTARRARDDGLIRVRFARSRDASLARA